MKQEAQLSLTIADKPRDAGL